MFLTGVTVLSKLFKGCLVNYIAGLVKHLVESLNRRVAKLSVKAAEFCVY
jgi:hypothetical protein